MIIFWQGQAHYWNDVTLFDSLYGGDTDQDGDVSERDANEHNLGSHEENDNQDGDDNEQDLGSNERNDEDANEQDGGCCRCLM